MSRNTFLHATHVSAASHRDISSTASLRRSQFLLVHGEGYLATLSPTYPPLRDTTLFSLSSTDSQRCATSSLATKRHPRPNLHRFSYAMLSASTASRTLLSLTVVPSSRHNFGTP